VSFARSAVKLVYHQLLWESEGVRELSGTVMRCGGSSGGGFGDELGLGDVNQLVFVEEEYLKLPASQGGNGAPQVIPAASARARGGAGFLKMRRRVRCDGSLERRRIWSGACFGG
jgi:hypothetical protein